MKRFLTVLISLTLCLMFIGCTPGRAKGGTAQSKTNASKIPMPTWSDRGRFYSSENSETTLWVDIGYTTLDDYRNYVKALQDYGYVLNVHEETDYMFWGENEEGYGVQLTYTSWSRYMGLQVTSNAADWNGWWKN